jgi:hypothetical protein
MSNLKTHKKEFTTIIGFAKVYRRLHLTKVYQWLSLSKVYKDPYNDKNIKLFGEKPLVLFSHHSIFY